MLQNKILFNQSAVSLEISGLPDVSIDDSNDNVSIISQWKLMIIDKPLIEGNLDHLSSIMSAFYIYSNSLMLNENPLYESKLIDIKCINSFTHNLLLKSSKPNVKPLNIRIGNSVLADIVNCFDQFNSSNKVKNLHSTKVFKISKNVTLLNIKKHQIKNLILPPILSICSLFIFSITLIYFYNINENKDKNNALNTNISVQLRKKII